jgi:sugar phosphate isomerase/epimerase
MQDYFLSAFADEFSSDFETQCKALNKFGFSHIELRGINGKNVSTLIDEEVEMVKNTLIRYNVKVSSIGSPLGKISLDGDVDLHFETAKNVFNIAKNLGAKFVRVFSFYLPEGKTREDCKGQVVKLLEKLLDMADDYGVTLCHENEALIYGESPDDCLFLLNTFNGRLKCVFDMGNFVLDGYNPFDAYKKLYDYIQYFHVKDALYEGAIVPAGKGNAEISKILNDFRKDNKGFFITLEPHLQTFSGLNALVGKAFDNPFKYENQEKAFEDAVKKLREIL